MVIALYLILTLGVGALVSRNQRTAADYFLGARELPAWAILLSIVATETSALTVISIPAVAARGDLTFLQLPLGYLIGRIAVAAWLLPGYFKGEQETAYARLESRFGPPTRRVTSLIFLGTRAMGDPRGPDRQRPLHLRDAAPLAGMDRDFEAGVESELERLPMEQGIGERLLRAGQVEAGQAPIAESGRGPREPYVVARRM